jgi:hypothetical protein
MYPFLVLEVGNAFRVPTFRNYTLVNPQVGSPRDLGVRHHNSSSFIVFIFGFAIESIKELGGCIKTHVQNDFA